MKRKISIIIPCYNVEKYVTRCIKSIINQSYGIENMDIILVNDGSKDNTIAIINGFGQKYPENIRVINMPINRGLGAARNIGLDFAEGDYIMFID